ncbi:hypothetical protein LCM28_19110 [Salipiger pacificus]|nr:hypothetical protein [Alloyangia pacifica]
MNKSHLIVGDARTKEVKQWEKWFGVIPHLRDRFYRSPYELDPFYWNETASVACLGNAATMADFVALTEYVLPKRQAARGRPFRRGRCDLWVANVDQAYSWVFEFKQHFANPDIRQSTFESQLQKAHDDAKSVDRYEGDRRFGGLILAPKKFDHLEEEEIDYYDELCSAADIAYRVSGALGPVWLAFAKVD